MITQQKKGTEKTEKIKKKEMDERSELPNENSEKKEYLSYIGILVVLLGLFVFFAYNGYYDSIVSSHTTGRVVNCPQGQYVNYKGECVTQQDYISTISFRVQGEQHCFNNNYLKYGYYYNINSGDNLFEGGATQLNEQNMNLLDESACLKRVKDIYPIDLSSIMISTFRSRECLEIYKGFPIIKLGDLQFVYKTLYVESRVIYDYYERLGDFCRVTKAMAILTNDYRLNGDPVLSGFTNLNFLKKCIDEIEYLYPSTEESLDFLDANIICNSDLDDDTIINVNDNCLDIPNQDQADSDNNGIGNACDQSQDVPPAEPPQEESAPIPIVDTDSDGITDDIDNCRFIVNADQANRDGDSLGDACDNCPAVANQDQADSNSNGIGDACEVQPAVCVDTDANEVDPFLIRGGVSVGNELIGEDSCRGSTLVEWKCFDDGSSGSIAVDCISGRNYNGCQNGACISLQVAGSVDELFIPQELLDYFKTTMQETKNAVANCQGDNCRLAQYSCENNLIKETVTQCNSCNAGVCVAPQPAGDACSDSDGGNDPLVAGTVTNNGVVDTDSCNDQYILNEWMCDGENTRGVLVSCGRIDGFYGCEQTSDGGRCLPIRCDNNIKDGRESDVDCGGWCPNLCADRKACNTNNDCRSGTCTNGVCSAVQPVQPQQQNLVLLPDEVRQFLLSGENVLSYVPVEVCPAGESCKNVNFACSDGVVSFTEGDVCVQRLREGSCQADADCPAGKVCGWDDRCEVLPNNVSLECFSSMKSLINTLKAGNFVADTFNQILVSCQNELQQQEQCRVAYQNIKDQNCADIACFFRNIPVADRACFGEVLIEAVDCSRIGVCPQGMQCGEDNKCNEIPNDNDGDGILDNEDADPNNPNIGRQCNEQQPCPAGQNCDGGACQIPPPAGDSDGDNVPDVNDNCPNAVNPHQEDADADGTGDACEAHIEEPQCDANDDCEQGKTCVAGFCVVPQPVVCHLDSDCAGALVCKDGQCTELPGPVIGLCKQFAINITENMNIAAAERTIDQNNELIRLLRAFHGAQECRQGFSDAENQKINNLMAAVNAADPSNAENINALIASVNELASAGGALGNAFNPAFCSSTDPGLNILTKGIVTYFNTTEKRLIEVADACTPNVQNRLGQYECKNNVAVLNETLCDNKCENGACVPSALPPGQRCVAIAGMQGAVLVDNLPHTPQCSGDRSSLIVYTCVQTPQLFEGTAVPCPLGCENNACKVQAGAQGQQQTGSGDTGTSRQGTGGGGGRRRGTTLSRQAVCGDGACQSAFGETQINCPQDCGAAQPAVTTPKVPSEFDKLIAGAPSGPPSMPLSSPKEGAYVALQPTFGETVPKSPYPQRPTEEPVLELPKEEESNLWLYVLIGVITLGLLGGGAAVAYTMWEKKQISAIPDTKKQRIKDYINYYSKQGYTKETLTNHLLKYGVPKKFIDDTYEEITAGSSARVASAGAGAAVAGTGAGLGATGESGWDKFKSKMSETWDKVKSVFKKKDEF